jgi:DNA modification methylase
MTEYEQFLKSKQHRVIDYGKSIAIDDIHPKLFDWQKVITKWAVRKGRCAIFLDTGLGKTFCQLEWARLIGENTLIIAPLSVARQTVREAKKIDLDVTYIRSNAEIQGDNKLWITNYEMCDELDYSKFGAVVLDESSILKSIGGKTRKVLTDLCKEVPYKLCCTATPAPNDYIELGNHTEFLGICKMQEMLAQFFINANKEHTITYGDQMYRRKGSNKNGTEWRLKHHAEQPFFKWLASWAITMVKPSDLGYDDNGFILPKLNITPIYTHTDYVPTDQLFFTGLHGIANRAEVRRDTIESKLEELKKIVSLPSIREDERLAGITEESSKISGNQWIIFCGLEDEQKSIADFLGNRCISVYGSLSADEKEKRIESWINGEVEILLSKPKICGFGLNLQQAHNMIFFGLNDSWETWYQSIRREWRYGQKKEVNVYAIMHEAEQEIYQNIMRKDAMARRLRESLIAHIRDYEEEELGMTKRLVQDYKEDIVKTDNYTLMLGDSCKRLAEIPENSIDLSVYSPPFSDLFTYSASEHDLGNSNGENEFFSHYAFIIREVLRVTKAGRLTCVHTSDIPAMQQKDGYIGLKDFPGDVIRAYEKEGWKFVGRAYIQKNPQSQAIRIHSKALAFGQLRKDSTDIRPALIDQVLFFRKDGDNLIPVTPVENGEMDNEMWIEWAHGIWIGISETDTLQVGKARGTEDEKHICPLQLQTIERCIKLYSNPNETVLDPFNGIGSTGYEALKYGRKYIGIELKPEYYEVAKINLKTAEELSTKKDLFTFSQEESGVVNE